VSLLHSPPVLYLFLTVFYATDRLGDSEQRFKDIDKEFDSAREQAKKAKDAFNIVKKKRCDLFNKAFHHIEERIDQVYKDLTKGKASPQGGIAYLSLEEPEVSSPTLSLFSTY